jgi:hypothetical protein
MGNDVWKIAKKKPTGAINIIWHLQYLSMTSMSEFWNFCSLHFGLCKILTIFVTIQLTSNSLIKMHDLSFLDQSERNSWLFITCENYRLFSLVMIIRKIYYKFCSLNSLSNTAVGQSWVDGFCGVLTHVPHAWEYHSCSALVQIQAWVTFVTAPQKLSTWLCLPVVL